MIYFCEKCDKLRDSDTDGYNQVGYDGMCDDCASDYLEDVPYEENKEVPYDPLR